VGEDGFEANAYDAYLAGMRWAATQYAKAQKAAMETRQPNQAAQLHFQRKGRTFDGKRESALAMMDTLSKALGEDFWVFESYEKNGKRVYADETGAEHAAPNGFYDKNGVHIDLNAGNDGRGVMLYTLGHELTHYIRQNSPEKFKAFADLIMESFGNRGVSADALIQEQIAKAARNGRNISYETAYEEMIADSMETILADGKALERLGQIQQKEPSLGQTIRQWAKDTAEKIRAVVNAYKGEKADSLEGRITAQLEQVLPELEELYAEGLADASGTGRAETREGAKKAAPEGGVKYQLREADGKQVVWIDDNILKQNDGQPTHQFIANYIAEHIGEVYTILESGQKVYIGEELPKEYTQSKYTQTILRRNKSLLQAKNRAVSGMGEMIEIATNRRWEKTRHTQSKDAKYGMYRYDTSFGFPVLDDKGNVVRANVYNAELIIRNASDGKKYLYDIIDIKKDTASSDWLTKTQPERQETLPARGGNVFSESIAQRTQNVNRNLSEELTGSLHSDRDAGKRFSLRDTEIPTRSELESKGKINVVDLSKPKTTGTFKERRKMILEEAKEVIRQPYLNQDTNTLIFITENSYRHIFNNLGEVQLNAAEHLPELIENAVLTHAEQPTHGSEYATGVYTFFAAAQDGNVLPVKLKVKEYSYTGQEIPRNIQEYFAGHPEDYAAMYDSVVLEVDGIEESPSGSAKDMSHNGPFLNPDELSAIRIADLLDLVNEKGEKYLPQYSDRDAGSAGPYAYDSLVSKPDMAVTRLSGDVPGNRADVIYQAKQNAAKIGRFNPKDGSVSVHVKDIDTDVILGTAGLKHSLDRRFDLNAPVTVMAGSILENSVRVNEMTAQHPNANQSYVLIGAAQGSNGQLYVVRSVVNQFSNEVTSMDVLYAYNAKTEPTLSIKEGTGRETIPNGPQRNAATITGSTISISELLDYVNDYFPDILPEEVLKHYGHESRPEGKLGESVLYSDRDPEAVKRNQILERQNEDLKDTVQYLKELVRLQGKVTDGTVYSRNSVEWAGKQMMKEANAKGDIRELTEILEKTYRAMGEGSENMTQLIDQAAGWLADHRKTEKPRLDSYAEGILKEMKGRAQEGKGIAEVPRKIGYAAQCDLTGIE
jgi:DNA-binding helix-turn-helix protein